MDSKRISDFIRGYKWIIFLFLLSTAYILYKHYISISWDFSVYVLNAQYFFGSGQYFEMLRPPLMPLILGIFSFLGWKASEFAFIILASAAFAFTSYHLAKLLKLDPLIFYLISLNAYVLDYGLFNGTELLSLILLELAVIAVLAGNVYSGFFISLGALARYTSFALLPIVLLHLNLKKIVKSMLLFAVPLVIWLAYNRYAFGNFLSSIADGYANNILFRAYIHEPMAAEHFVHAINLLIPFFIIGVIAVLFASIRKIEITHLLRTVSKLKSEIIMFFVLISAIISYQNIPIKNPRYLFGIMLPVFYFSYKGLEYFLKKDGRLGDKDKRRKVMAIVAIALFGLGFAFLLGNIYFGDYEKPSIYTPAVAKLSELNLSGCATMSNSWVMLSYLGITSEPDPRGEMLDKSLSEGKILVLFKHIRDHPYANNASFIQALPVLYDSERYVIAGHADRQDGCASAEPFFYNFLEQMDAYFAEFYGYNLNTNPCLVMFSGKPLLEKTCNLLNGNGFVQDEYRAIG